MVCPRCHQRLKPDSRFCTSCGSPIEIPPEQIKPAEASRFSTVKMSGDGPLEVPGVKPSAPRVPTGSSSVGKVIGVVGALLVVALATVAGIVWLNRSASSDSHAQPDNANSVAIGGSVQASSNDPMVRRILGTWRNRTGKLELKFQESPTGIEGVILKVPDVWPKERVKVGDSVFAKGKVVGDTIEGLYINLPQGTDCQNLETRYSKCVISFDSDSVIRVTNSAWQYSFPECKWSLVTYDDAWNWYKQ